MRSAQQVPAAIRVARTMWFIAIGAGVFETVLILAGGRAGGGAVVGVAVRAVVFAAAALVVLRMYAGHRGARWVLTATLGVLGTLSLTVGPFLWLVRGDSLTRLIRGSGIVDLLFGGSRVVHVAAVLCGCVLMFVPSANSYFRTPASRLAVAVAAAGRQDAHVNVFRPADGGPYACPCCGCRTLAARGSYDLCPVCFWEDDGQDDHDADRVRGGPNSLLSLTQARHNFAALGACDERCRQFVRPPTAEERRPPTTREWPGQSS